MRIPKYETGKEKEWFDEMARIGLLFHPEDSPEDIVDIRHGNPLFTPAEIKVLKKTLQKIYSTDVDFNMLALEAYQTHFKELT